MRNKKLKWVSGSLHSHGFWTKYRNWHEQKLAPFNLDFFVKTCMRYGRDFQAVLDIMANQKGRNEFQENRYDSLIKTAKPNKEYEVEFFPNSKFPIETKIYFKDGREFYIPRTQEIITENLLAHILALGLGKNNNISGGRNARKTLEDIKQRGGYAFINHPFVCDAFTKEQVLKFYEEGLILGAEFNGGVTIDSKLGEYLARKVGKIENPPLKKDNEKILDLEKKVLIIANDDARCKSDVKNGAYTSYGIDADSDKSITKRLVKSMQNESKSGLQGTYIKRHERYSKGFSMWYHGACGVISQLTQNPSLPAI